MPPHKWLVTQPSHESKSIDARTSATVFIRLGSSYFYLFAKLKTTLIEETFDGEQELFNSVTGVLNAVPTEGFESVFDE
jgi:hypothetical protein